MRRAATLLAAAAMGLPAGAGPAEERAFARALLARVQPLSFVAGVEHCGYVGRDRATGRLRATPPARGTRDACTSPWPEGMEVLATYHTHGPFDPAYHGELPSEGDIRSDEALGVEGWIATPGGRLWHVDPSRMQVVQACGVGCLPVARGFTKAHAGEIAKAYDFAQLRERLSQ